MTNAKKAALGVLLLLSAAMAACWFIYSPIAERDFLSRYAAAGVLSSTGTAPSPTWDHSISLPDGVSARVVARGGMGGTVEIFYGPSERHLIYRYVDYIYPVEIKLSPDRQFLFATVSGLAGGVFQSRYTYEFDLHGRTIVSKHRIRSQ